MIRILARLRSDRRGVVAIEFALISTFLFGTLIVALDFGFYIQQKLRLGSVVEQAVVLAYNTQVSSSTTTIRDYVQTYAGTRIAPTATITCNGTSTCGDGKCSCITATGTFTVMGSCNASCASVGSAAVSGNYLKIVATMPYTATIVPDRYLGGTNITQSAVVRLQ